MCISVTMATVAWLHTAECYLLQIQQYNLPTSNAANKKAAVNATTIAPATGQQQVAGEPTQWYDVDVVKSTVHTVTGYQIPTGEKVCHVLYL